LFCGGGALLISHEKYIKDDKVLNHLELRSKVLIGPLADLRDRKSVVKPTQALKSVKGTGNAFD
jgi:hypothetical protein